MRRWRVVIDSRMLNQSHPASSSDRSQHRERQANGVGMWDSPRPPL